MMIKLILKIELDYDPEMVYGDDAYGKELFFAVLKIGKLFLYADELGDKLGEVTVLEINTQEGA